MPQGVANIDRTTTGGGKELTRRQPPAVVERHDVGNPQVSSHSQRADAQLLDAVGVHQIEPLCCKPAATKGLHAHIVMTAPAAGRQGQADHPRALPLVHLDRQRLFDLPDLAGLAWISGLPIKILLPGCRLGAEHRDLPLITELLLNGPHLILGDPGGTANALGGEVHVQHKQPAALRRGQSSDLCCRWLDQRRPEGLRLMGTEQLLGPSLGPHRHGAGAAGIRQQLLHRVHPAVDAPGETGVNALLKALGVSAGGAEHAGQTEIAELHPADGTFGIGVEPGLQGHQANVGLSDPAQIGGVITEGMAADPFPVWKENQRQLEVSEQIQLQSWIALEQLRQGRSQLLNPDLLVGLGATGHQQTRPASDTARSPQGLLQRRRRQIGQHLNRLIGLQLVPAAGQGRRADDDGITGPHRCRKQRNIELEPTVVQGRDRAPITGQRRHAVLGIDHQVIHVVPGGQPGQSAGFDRPQHLNRGWQATDDHRISPEQGLAPIPVLQLLALDDPDRTPQGLQLLTLLVDPVQKTLGQVVAGQQQPVPVGPRTLRQGLAAGLQALAAANQLFQSSLAQLQRRL